jgi:hypothetical protein
MNRKEVKELAKENIWISPHPEGWAAQREHSERASRVFPTKIEAEMYGRGLARQDGVELFVQRLDGTIQDRRSFGNDPYPPRDKR